MAVDLEFITFLLAPIGYAGLTTVAGLAVRGRMPLTLLRVTVAIIVLHVFLVWHVRYEWDFSEATRNGYAGFALFHGALAAILVSTVTPLRIARILLTAAFLVVTLGAVAATATYDVVRVYQVPVVLIALLGILALAYRPASAMVKRLSR
jgi:hypothetical protein